jgi:hypothetical protein
MKKILSILLLGSITLGGFSLQSCEKCTTCSYTYELNGQTKTFSYPEVCGDRDDVNDLEDLCEEEALAVAGSCNCD